MIRLVKDVQSQIPKRRAIGRVKKTTDSDVSNSDQAFTDETYRDNFLEKLKSISPGGFERICQRLLRESGFEQVTVTGKSGDGGIDGHGILEINAFVSFKVLFQRKRYEKSATASHVRDFRGAMAGEGG